MNRRFIPRSLRLWLLFLAIAAVSHILATFWLASAKSTTDFLKLTEELPVNRFSLLQPISPETQPLPFMMPEAHYSVCPFDTSEGPVLLDVDLQDAGWILSLHAPDGTVIYFAPGVENRDLNLRLALMPPGDQFLGLPLSGGPGSIELPEVQLDEFEGVAILRAPLYGRSYAALAANALKRSSCRLVPRIPRPSRTAGHHENAG